MTRIASLILLTIVFTAFFEPVTRPVHALQRARRVTAPKRPAPEKPLTRAEIREAESALGELGYWTGPVDGSLDDCSRHALIAFQKIERRETSGKLTRSEIEAVLAAGTPAPLETGYEHVEVDIARQVLFFVDAGGAVSRIIPVSTGNEELFKVYGEPNRAYTPRGRFEVYNKGVGWQESPLGLLYYPSYLIGGIAIHGNPAVPTKPASHGCIRVPMCVAKEVAKLLPVGSKVIVHDGGSFANGLTPWPDEPHESEDEAEER
jgi:N-acetylmuramoyl-L-alanine amidase